MKNRLRIGKVRPGSYYGITDPGLIRDNNEDAFCILKDQALLVLADGLGGRNAGEIASQTAVGAVKECFARAPGWLSGCLHSLMPGLMFRKMVKAVEYANLRIQQKSQVSSQYEGMGTTLVITLIRGRWLYKAHIGDSRAYIINSGGIRQLTRDHTLAEDMNYASSLTAAEARHHPLRNLLTRDLNGSLAARPDISRHRIGSGDTVLLCSDGLWGMIDDSRIQRTILACRSLEEAGKKLVERANIAGGRDNITVVLMKIE